MTNKSNRWVRFRIHFGNFLWNTRQRIKYGKGGYRIATQFVDTDSIRTPQGMTAFSVKFDPDDDINPIVFVQDAPKASRGRPSSEPR